MFPLFSIFNRNKKLTNRQNYVLKVEDFCGRHENSLRTVDTKHRYILNP